MRKLKWKLHGQTATSMTARNVCDQNFGKAVKQLENKRKQNIQSMRSIYRLMIVFTSADFTRPTVKPNFSFRAAFKMVTDGNCLKIAADPEFAT